MARFVSLRILYWFGLGKRERLPVVSPSPINTYFVCLAQYHLRSTHLFPHLVPSAFSPNISISHGGRRRAT